MNKFEYDEIGTIFDGKTIKTVDTSCANFWIFKFTDGTSIELWADSNYDRIPFMYIETEINKQGE